MYFIQKMLRYEALMEPMSFGRHLKEQIRKRLRDDVEGTVHESLGVIIAVLEYSEDNDSQEGMIEYETGMASFVLTYSAIVFRPFKDQVLDGKVSSDIVHFLPCFPFFPSPSGVDPFPLRMPTFSGDGCQLPWIQSERGSSVSHNFHLKT